jgi:ubiquinone/menaquinone biosynthesis C-methylase UbiE
MTNEFDVENPDNAELKKMYNDETRFSWTFDSLNGYEDYQDKYRMHAVISAVKKRKPTSILDNGCGSALMSRELAGSGHSVVGLDISNELLKRVATTANLQLVVGDSENLPFDNSVFDCVICSEVLEHIKDNQPAIKEIRRVMKEDGFAVISVPNWDCFDSLEGNFGIVTIAVSMVNYVLDILKLKPIYPYGVNPHFHKMFPWQWKRLFESSGLEVIEDKAIYLVPYIPKFRYVERWIYKIPGLFSIKTKIDDIFSGIWPFKYMGIAHLFVCRKKGNQLF